MHVSQQLIVAVFLLFLSFVALFYYFCRQRYSIMDLCIYSRILDLLHREVKPALGCTEPIAVALCVSRAVAAHPDYPNCLERIGKVTVCVSESILKNAMGVGIPGTGQIGLPIAIALVMPATPV